MWKIFFPFLVVVEKIWWYPCEIERQSMKDTDNLTLFWVCWKTCKNYEYDYIDFYVFLERQKTEDLEADLEFNIKK